MTTLAMTVTPNEFLQSLQEAATKRVVRYPVFVAGDEAYLSNFLALASPSLIVSDVLPDATPWNQVKRLLGQETHSLALDIRQALDVEKLCAVAGCVRGGELVYFLVDGEEGISESRFYQRFRTFYHHADAATLIQQKSQHVSQTESMTLPQSLSFSGHGPEYTSLFTSEGMTHDQQLAVDAIKQVLKGHRRRPVLIVADRGRGKSSAMGIAAKQMLSSEVKTVLVTAPSIANAETLFQHALLGGDCTRANKYLVTYSNGSQLKFVAPDALLQDTPTCDLLLVDEAAAIPVPMLNQMLASYSRIGFSTTEHGYEGTGRAFSLRFRNLLNEKAKGWKEVTLTQPVRWAQDDPLERWLFDAFLFDAEPVYPDDIGDISVRRINRDALLQDEAMLRQLFSILVTAHYQTSPNDLLQLLDDESLTVFGAFANDTVVGALLAQKEGGFDDALAADVVGGKRRLRGHLLAQSLASHTGTVDALTSELVRVSRIAVLPSLQRRGIGTLLLNATQTQASKDGIDVMGTSFGVTPSLWQFWSSQGYLPARLGIQRDAASGTHSLQLIKALSAPPAWFDDIQALFASNFYAQLSEQFRQLDPRLSALLLNLVAKPATLSDAQTTQVALFASGALGYDLVTGSLSAWMVSWLSRQNNTAKLEEKGCTLMVARVLHRQAWDAVANEFGYQGRKDTELAMRQWVAQHL
ncbi:tRNA(Met) cytidine acetyltransferase TmcA [Enterovibrio baiacu]|uniref:tRNA(Met) cytidine acetyltransferase TmcA n=1 Tax=Enterovibrio baiacu TaxID=2491023 RepID=UPI0010109873|nr:GNAT family N-acetyltransferase [Enterovibrio baiacu]MBE1275626.1 tRNA(Met) cytidine acetyltransferase [Enterovibrio baiacu]